MKSMRAELRDLKSSGKGVDRPEEFDMSEDNEDQNDEAVEKPTWLGVLAPTRVAPQVSDAVCLANLLVDPPPLDQLKPVETNRRYEKVPETPAPRRNRVDQTVFVAQRKLEQCMHLMVHYCESGDRKIDGGRRSVLQVGMGGPTAAEARSSGGQTELPVGAAGGQHQSAAPNQRRGSQACPDAKAHV